MGFFDNIGGFFSSLGSKVKDLGHQAWAGVSTIGSTVYDKVVTPVANFGANQVDKITGVGKSVGGLVDNGGKGGGDLLSGVGNSAGFIALAVGGIAALLLLKR